ncbi:MAG: Gfo/Idh/MocA family oxidoreductase [Acidimicrobiia bacterium]|nr:Gfo/Idh/MocA family oxidoreductase [Acidimicrobiia bacterium]
MHADMHVAVIGAGGIGRAYLDVLEKSPQARLSVVADAHPETRERIAQEYGVPTVATHRELGDVDAAIVCTPPSTHPEITMHLLRNGIPVLCEKPLAIDLADARAMASAAEESGVLLTMASKFRYVPDVIATKSLINSGILGDIVLYENTFASVVEMRDRWNADPELSGGGVLIDNGTHSLDIARYLLGPIDQVLAVEGHRIQRLPVEDTVRVFFRSVSDVTGTIDLSWSIRKELDSYVDIYGSKGTVQIGWRTSRFRQHNSSEWIEFGSGYSKMESIGAQVQNFLDAIDGRDKLLIGAGDGIASVQVVEAAYRSLRANNWTEVSSPASPMVEIA